MTVAQGCTQVSSVDPDIAAYRQEAGVAPLDPTANG
jgi:hypothetical protein